MSVKSDTPSNTSPHIPSYIEWLFPYKKKPLPISTNTTLSYYLFQNKISLALINWAFQGMRGMDKTDLAGKICFELLLFALFISLVQITFMNIFFAFFLAHTFNWFLNSNFWVIGRYLGITRTDPARFSFYLRKVMYRMQQCSSIDAVIVIGGASRKQGVRETSDIDIFFIRDHGFFNGIRAVISTIRERIIAFLHRFPLHLELYDSIKTMERHRKDETPFVLKDNHREARGYYESQGRKIAGFDEYRKEAE